MPEGKVMEDLRRRVMPINKQHSISITKSRVQLEESIMDQQKIMENGKWSSPQTKVPPRSDRLVSIDTANQTNSLATNRI